MIVVRLKARLGNQLFQYATGRALALRLGVPLAFDRRSFPRPDHQPQIDVFDLPVVPANDQDLPLERHSVMARVFQRPHAALKGTRLHRERRDLKFDPNVLSLPDNSYLDGYFQSEGYFADRADQIRSDLEPPPPSEADRSVLAAMDATTPVSVHVRRGDYVESEKLGRLFGTCEPPYYREAAALIAGRVGGPVTFFVFSDDPDWAAANLDLGFPTVVVDHNGPEAGHHDMRLMAACRHHVIANSSFSWWGAWLNDRPDKIVVAPRTWFKSGRWDDSALVPDAWIRL